MSAPGAEGNRACGVLQIIFGHAIPQAKCCKQPKNHSYTNGGGQCHFPRGKFVCNTTVVFQIPFFPRPATLWEATASDMSLSGPGQREEKSTAGSRAKLEIFCAPQLLCFSVRSLVSSPPSLPQPRAVKKRPLVVCQWFVLLSPHKSWWTKTSPQCGVMSGGCL